MTDTRQRAAVVIGVLLLVTPVVMPATTPVTAETTEPAADPTAAQMQSTNNSTTVHQNPDNVRARGNLTAVQSWLGDRIGTTLADCARRTDPAANGTCAALTEGGAYSSLAARYSNVARLTGDPGDDAASRVLNRTAEHQFAFVRAVVRYRSTLETYRRVRQQGRVRRAQALARRVSQQGDAVVAAGDRVISDYRILAGNSTIPVSRARSITSSTMSNASATTEEVRTASFNPPRLVLSRNVTPASFDDPAVVRGRLSDPDDGRPLSDRSIVVQTPEMTLRTETNANGTFNVTYRPTAAPVGNATVVVRYRPRDDSEYTPVENRTNVSVRPTEATLQLNETTSTVGFGDELRVRGRLGAGGVGAPNASVIVSVDGTPLATTETNETGRFVATGQVPAAVPSGSSSLTVSLAPGDRALRADPVSRSVEVERTTPRLFAGTERLDADTARIFGAMRVGTTRVSNASLEIRRDGNPITTVSLSDEGTFERNVSLLDLPANGTAVLTVVYDPPGGNLEPVELRAGVGPVSTGLPEIPPASEVVADRIQPLLRLDPVPFAVGSLAVLLIFLVASGAALRGRGRLRFGGMSRRIGAVGSLLGHDSGSAGTDWPAEMPSPATERGGDGDTADADVDQEETFMQAAHSRFNDGRTDDAVIVAYGAVRHHLQSRLGVDPSLTHWELLTVHRDALADDQREALERLTAAYESAAFSPARSTVETAHAALDSAAHVLGRERVSDRTSHADD
ncbi:carboxypeptidase-like regulatory domain-containing protein [Haloplanus ruber]|uniref:Carboxypeptidase-like regulatory domain-containing protein n=1 Tax=Haloplanus ruber TaxID=869892 RepID=A0ABD6CVZ7_9EURY|nr:carboxypeptidase-like regulatory domain-containing protein [Haloplanus ruber]